MQKEVRKSWALFLGIGIIMIAQGLQNNLMGIRAVIENFSTLTTGIFMSGYFVGYFFGSYTTPILISKVGHIRVFAAFASLASLSILIAVTFVDPIMWTLSRFITGVSLVSCYIVSESWLNDRATNRNRGQLLSTYMVVLWVGLAIGMLLLNIDSPENYGPFILVSILMSVSLVPILLTKRPAPKFKKISTLSLKELYKISPLGFVSSFFTGAMHAGFLSLLSVYATAANYSLFETSIILTVAVLSGALAQGPIGYLSDNYDRRKIIIFSTVLSSIFALFCIISSNSPEQNLYWTSEFDTSKIIFIIFIGLYSCFSLPLFSQNLAHTNDYVPKEKFVAAGGGLQIVFGVGAITGPIIGAIFMESINLNGFFVFLIITNLLIATFGIYRSRIRETVDNPESSYTPLPQTITPVGLELDPTTPETLDNPTVVEEKPAN